MALPEHVNSAVDIDEATTLARIRKKGIQSILSEMTHEECVRLTLRFGTHNYHPVEITIVEGDGPWVVDSEGRRYIDCVGCYSALALGHLPKPVLSAMEEQAERLTLTGRAVYTKELALFLRVLCEFSEMEMACPMNSGAEAVETAIKIARRWAYSVKGVPDGQAEIIAAEENFHGRTTTIVGFSSEAPYRQGFGPFTPGFKLVPFGNIDAVRAAITPNTAAVLMEPIQAEGGILLPPAGFLAALRKVCDENRVLLIWDEIQTGFCRTGHRFAWQAEVAEPDLMCLGKALGGGVMPVSAVVGKREVMQLLTPGSHGSTFGGNPLSAVAAIAALCEMDAHAYEREAVVLGNLLMESIRDLGHPIVREVRGRGLLVGIEIEPGYDESMTQAFLRNGILTKETRHRTFRFAPPLNCGRAIILEIVDRVKRALHEAEGGAEPIPSPVARHPSPQ